MHTVISLDGDDRRLGSRDTRAQVAVGAIAVTAPGYPIVEDDAGYRASRPA